jgi:energy-coupling factor transporter transmembrane protein EcfT
MEMRPRRGNKRRERPRKVSPRLVPAIIIIVCVWVLVAAALGGYFF